MKFQIAILLLSLSYVILGNGQKLRASSPRELNSFKKWFCKKYPQNSWCLPACPVISPVSNFDLDKYISKTWYIQKQQVNPYQKENQLYCVTATYKILADRPGYISVINQGRNNGIDGPFQNSGPSLCAKNQTKDTGYLKVAPCVNDFFFNLISGPYWVIAVDDDYEWAIVSGGQTKNVRQQNPTLCTTSNSTSFFNINGSGLWLFTRTPVATQSVIDKMEKMLVDMGVYTGDLKNVVQDGCKYDF